MEDKQLDFGQPLMSVRRSTPTVALNNNNERRTQTMISNVPHLPFYKSELKSGPVRNLGTVPFVWEQSPGRPKDKDEPQSNAVEEPTPYVSRRRNFRPKEQDCYKISQDSNAYEHNGGRVHYAPQIAGAASLRENKLKVETCMERVEENSDSGDDESEYLDALDDALSNSESFYLNSSLSDLSGLGEPDFKPSRTSADQQTRDLMMGRFLPAARAMTSETPHHTSRRPTVVLEQPRQVRVVRKEMHLPVHYGPNLLVHSVKENEDEEESDDDIHDRNTLAAKGCGLLPRFRNSSCLFNLAKGMSMKSQIPLPSVSHRKTRSSPIGTEAQKSIGIGYPAQMTTSEFESIGCEHRSVLKNEAGRNNCQILAASSSFRHLQCNKASSHHDKLSQSSLHKQNDFICRPREIEKASSLRETSNISPDQIDHGSNNIKSTPVSEKTLFVDGGHKVRSSKQDAILTVMTEPSDIEQNDLDIHAKFRDTKESSLASLKYNDCLDVVDKQPNSLKPSDCIINSKLKEDIEMDNKAFTNVEDIEQDSILENSKHLEEVIQDHKAQPRKAETCKSSSVSETALANCLEFSSPPPLPKSPSDSWLFRTLGSTSSRYQYTGPYNNIAEINPLNHAYRDTRWSTTNKTTKELMSSIPEDSERPFEALHKKQSFQK